MEVVKDPAGSIPLKSRGENSSSQSLWEGWKQLEEELDEGFTAAICTLGIKSLQNPPFFYFPCALLATPKVFLGGFFNPKSCFLQKNPGGFPGRELLAVLFQAGISLGIILKGNLIFQGFFQGRGEGGRGWIWVSRLGFQREVVRGVSVSPIPPPRLGFSKGFGQSLFPLSGFKGFGIHLGGRKESCKKLGSLERQGKGECWEGLGGIMGRNPWM